jgi:hypothetical protein
MAMVGFVVGLIIALALVFEGYQVYQQIMQEVRFQQFMFPYDQPTISPQYQNIGNVVIIHAVAAAVLIVISLSSGFSPSKVHWIFYTITAVFGIAAGVGASQSLFGVAVLVGLVSIFSPIVSSPPMAISTSKPSSAPAGTTVAEIERLEGLLKRDLIDEAEFQQLKKKILARGE